MDRIVTIGIIGCGGIAHAKHLPVLLKCPNAKVVALCDTPERTKALKERFGLSDAVCYERAEDLLADPNVQAVNICTPNASHAPLSIAAMRAGKDVMCEKPMASDLAQARQMLQAQKETGRKLTICANMRFTPQVWNAKKVVERGDVGQVYYSISEMLRRRGVPVWGDFLDKDIQGGGPIIDLGVHVLDSTLWVMDNYEPHMVVGKTFDHIAKQSSPANPYGNWDPKDFTVEDFGVGMIIMKNGAVIDLKASWALNIRNDRQGYVQMFGTKGGLDWKPGELYLNGEQDGTLFDHKVILDPPKIDFYEPELIYGPQLEMDMWIDALIHDREPVTRPEQMVMASTILEAIYRSAETGEPVYFD